MELVVGGLVGHSKLLRFIFRAAEENSFSLGLSDSTIGTLHSTNLAQEFSENCLGSAIAYVRFVPLPGTSCWPIAG
ncbi:MAG: hypothetical protein AAFZ99_01040 [Pseudomonadota bacterium]